MTRVSTAAASKDRAAFGHQATHCMTPPNVQVRVHLPVRTSHRRTVPSSEAEASHCPEESGDMLRTYTSEKKSLLHSVPLRLQSVSLLCMQHRGQVLMQGLGDSA